MGGQTGKGFSKWTVQGISAVVGWPGQRSCTCTRASQPMQARGRAIRGTHRVSGSGSPRCMINRSACRQAAHPRLSAQEQPSMRQEPFAATDRSPSIYAPFSLCPPCIHARTHSTNGTHTCLRQRHKEQLAVRRICAVWAPQAGKVLQPVGGWGAPSRQKIEVLGFIGLQVLQVVLQAVRAGSTGGTGRRACEGGGAKQPARPAPQHSAAWRSTTPAAAHAHR